MDFNDSSETNLVNLSTAILDNHKNLDWIKSVMSDFVLSEPDSDMIVHVSHFISPIKDQLNDWQDFADWCYDRLVKLKGEEKANILRRVFE